MRRTTSPRTVVPCLQLAAWRAKAGVTIEQIEAVTKISRRFLLAIEDERFEDLPGGVFTISYLKQYAAATGFDEAELLARHAAREAESGEIERKPPGGGSLASRLGRWAFPARPF
jgi:cytoskeletal protein RodZ